MPSPKNVEMRVFRSVVKLIGQDDVERLEFFFQGADGAGGENPFHAEFLEPIDVGAEVEFRRRDRVIAIVPRQKCDAPSFERSDAIGIGWFSEGRFDFDFFERP